jgi:small conductance mechanosensitive channel
MEKELESLQKFYNVIIEFFVNYSFQLVGAVIIFLVGWYVAKKLSQYIIKVCQKYELDVTITKYIGNIVRVIVILGFSIVALGKLGITLTPFIAGIGAASLGAGLALQGMLSNYGAGISIILTRPFVVGNTITVQEISGVVEDIQLGHTVLSTEDGEMITIPNKHIVGEVLVNSFEYKVVESLVGVSYDCDIEKAIDIINNILDDFDESIISKKSKAQIGIKEFGDFSINIEYRYWAETKSYFQIQYKVNLEIIKKFKEEGINIPFPTHNLITENKV